MRGPEQVHLVAGTVQPVVAEVVEHQPGDPHPGAGAGLRSNGQLDSKTNPLFNQPGLAGR
jgi:hypothetical protein